MSDLSKIFLAFPVGSEAASIEPVGSGHINRTYMVTDKSGGRYILQRINRHVFHNVDAVMQNASRICDYLRKQGSVMPVIRYLDTADGRHWFEDGEGVAWRCYPFVEHSICLQRAETMEQIAESGRAFGAFGHALRDFPVDELEETIPYFHCTTRRYEDFHRALETDACSRGSRVHREIAFILEREKQAGYLQKLRETGELPLRVTHNDTKISNVLLHEKTGQAICVIDLDTVMPGLAAFDFGDAIRSCGSSAAEDEKDSGELKLDIDRCRAFSRGYLEAFPSLTGAEVRSLVPGAWTMTLECGLRFLTDFLLGDRYFPIDYEMHNLFRCRTQLRLAEEMEQHFDEMTRVVEEENAAFKFSGSAYGNSEI